MSNDVAFRNNRWSTPLNRSATNNSRFSVCSNVSQSAYGMRYEQAVVGQEVASKINISKLAIESTAFRDPQPQSTPVPQYSSTLSFTTAPSESVLENNQNDGSPDEYDSMGNEKVGFDILQAKKLKRRVTFDMDNIQVQTIPANMSSSLDNLSDTDDVNDTESSDSEDEEYKNKLTSDTDRVESKGHPFDQNHSTPATFHTGRRLVAEPSIKKLSIDNDPVHQPKLQKIDFWYPLNPPLQRTVLSTDRNGYYAQNTSLPFIKPLAETEKLIDDAIEREKKALQMNTCAITSRKNIFIDGRSAASTRFSASPALSSSDEMSSILICDSEEEEEDYDTIIRSRDPVSLSRSKPIVVHGKITDLNPNSQPIPLPLPASFHEQSSNNHPISHLPQLQSSLADSDSHFEHNLEMIHSNDTVSNVIPAPLPINNQSHSDDESIVFSKSPLSLETDFSKSIYNEFAKRHNQKLIPMEEFEPPKLTFPLEHELIPVSGAFNSDPALSINPQEDENSSSDDGMDIGYCLRPSSGTSVNDSISTVDEVNDPVWIDYTAETKLSSSSEAARKLFFVKVLKAENLDFPIENNESNIFCTVRYKDKEVKSIHQKMKHTVNINQEMIIQDIDPSEQITITLHVSMFSSNNAQKRSGSWYHKIKPGSITASSSSLERYIHDKDGSLCQTLLLPQRFMETEGQDQLATLMLVNNWYRQQSNSNGVAPNINGGASNPAALLKKKSSTFLLHRKHSVEFNHDDAENKSTTTTNSIEKAVGKLYIQCLYINTYGNYIPSGMDEALEALNAKRFHETKWQEGYLSQLGGNTKHWTKRYFILIGGSLIAYPTETELQDNETSTAMYEIPLARAVTLICNNATISEGSQQKMKELQQLQFNTAACAQDGRLQADNIAQHQCSENEFQLLFDNGIKIQFECKSAEECQKWTTVIEVMLSKLPALPAWIKKNLVE